MSLCLWTVCACEALGWEKLKLEVTSAILSFTSVNWKKNNRKIIKVKYCSPGTHTLIPPYFNYFCLVFSGLKILEPNITSCCNLYFSDSEKITKDILSERKCTLDSKSPISKDIVWNMCSLDELFKRGDLSELKGLWIIITKRELIF